MQKARLIFILLMCAILALPSPARSQTDPPLDKMVSLDPDGIPGDAASTWPAISPDGAHIAYVSRAANLDPADTNESADIYLVDAAGQGVRRVSVTSSGDEANAGSFQPALSANGRVVAFLSFATNLTGAEQDPDTNGLPDIYVHDRTAGTTSRVSVTSAGGQATGWNEQPSISGDGRFVAFTSTAPNLVEADTETDRDVFLHDRDSGETRLVSTSSGSIPPVGSASHPAISTDGRYIAYRYETVDSSGILLYDRLTGLSGIVGNQGSLEKAVQITSGPKISLEGNYIHWVERNPTAEETIIFNRSNQKQQSYINNPEKPFTYPGLHFPVTPPGAFLPAQSGSGRYAAYTAENDGLLQVFWSDQGASAEQAPLVSGWVVDSTGLPLAGARVQIGDARFIITGADGAFRFDSLAPKAYPLLVEKEGYTFSPEKRTVTAARGSITEIGLEFTALPQGAIDAGMKDLGMPYNLGRGCPSPFEPCGGPYNGFYSGDCTDLVMDAYLGGLDFNIQLALEADFYANPFHYYRWRNARSAHDMWRYFAYTNQILPVATSYQVGDIVFFDWQQDGIVDHVALISEVNRRGSPVRMLDATGVIEDNPDGRAVELEWKPYHRNSSPGHARWNGLPWSAKAPENRAATYLVAALDSPFIDLHLKDASGRSAGIAGLEIPGSQLIHTGLGTVISLADPVSGLLALELRAVSQAPFELGLQLVHNSQSLALHTLTGQLAAGETRLVGVHLVETGGQLSLELVP